MAGTSSGRRGERLRALAVCAPGLEGVVGAELEALGIKPQPTTRGGVPFGGSVRQAYAATARLRAASTVLVRLATFEARTFADLQREARAIDWEAYLAPGVHPHFRVSATASTLFHTDAIAERLHAVVGVGPAPRARATTDDEEAADGDGVDERDLPLGDGPAVQPFVVRLVHDRVTISVDAAGEPLHRRGWRLATAKAPLRPTLAAGALLALGWDGTAPLLDPMCGSGTLPIEAALLARRIAPGLRRPLALRSWPSLVPGTWASVEGEAWSLERDGEGCPPIVGGDRDAGAVTAATGNAERAGVDHTVQLRQASLSSWEPPPDTPPGLLLANPPWGHRLEQSGDLRDLYAALGRLLDGPLAGWSAAVVVDNPGVGAWAGRKGTSLWKAPAGGTPVHLLRLDPRRDPRDTRPQGRRS